MDYPQLSDFQYGSLMDAANTEVDHYMLVIPHPLDPIEQRQRWERNNFETDQLVEMGLLADISDKYTKQIEAEFKNCGRVFRIFRITNAGRAMFDERNSASRLTQ